LTSIGGDKDEKQTYGQLLAVTLGALGVVYGDIGTSPLYALKECFIGEHGVQLTEGNLFGIISLVIWSIISIVCIKYLIFVLRADNRGEGGVIALMALAIQSGAREFDRKRYFITCIGLIGAALLYGDGIITPSISVLSAVEGLTIAAPFFEKYITITVVIILVLLFYFQQYGTKKIGFFFGPVIVIWFITLGALGIPSILQTPEILEAFNPLYGLHYLYFSPDGIFSNHAQSNSMGAFFTLGAVFLALTGAEALYADMGHFGKKPIRLGFFTVAFPGLILNYLGQGALLLRDPTAVENPFYRLAPGWSVFPLVLLATVATVIASQALISGAYSLTSQAIQLGFLPRIKILHTSPDEYGQIYIPFVNWILLVGTVLLVLIFQSSSALASAYGIAVSTTMILTTILMFFVAKDLWKWSKVKIGCIFAPFIVIDFMFFSANAAKIFHGGWIPVIFALVLFTIMTTWWRGRRILWDKILNLMPPFRVFFHDLKKDEMIHIPGSAVYMIRDLKITPPALMYNIKHNKVIHEKVILLTVVSEDIPHFEDESTRVEIVDLGEGFFRVIIHQGFMESINVPQVLMKQCSEVLEIDFDDVTFFIDRVIPIPTDIPGMALWRESLFAFMSQNSLRATKFYSIPARYVVEIGFQVEI
jgi:KUP system potassium uptake protein